MLKLKLNSDEMILLAEKAKDYFSSAPPKTVQELALYLVLTALAQRLTLKAAMLSFGTRTEARMGFEITEILALRSLSYANTNSYGMASLISIHDSIDRWCASEIKKIQSQYQSRRYEKQ